MFTKSLSVCLTGGKWQEENVLQQYKDAKRQTLQEKL